MSEAHQFALLGDPRQGFELALATLRDAGFTLGPETEPYVVEAERGSKGATVMLGAFAGRKAQHLRVELRGVSQNGQNVILYVPSTTGMAGGAIGVTRANSEYHELARAIAARLHAAGVLQATSVPTP